MIYQIQFSVQGKVVVNSLTNNDKLRRMRHTSVVYRVFELALDFLKIDTVRKFPNSARKAKKNSHFFIFFI